MTKQDARLDQLVAEGWRLNALPSLNDGTHRVSLELVVDDVQVHSVRGSGASQEEARASAVLQANLWRQETPQGK